MEINLTIATKVEELLKESYTPEEILKAINMKFDGLFPFVPYENGDLLVSESLVFLRRWEEHQKRIFCDSDNL